MEVAVALDTNRLTGLLRGDPALADTLARLDQVWLALFVLGEMQAGFLGGAHGPHNQVRLHALLAKPTVGILYPNRETAGQYARLFVQLRRAGTPVPTNDLWIAALALQHGLRLLTRDRHFAAIPQLLTG